MHKVLGSSPNTEEKKKKKKKKKKVPDMPKGTGLPGRVGRQLKTVPIYIRQFTQSPFFDCDNKPAKQELLSPFYQGRRGSGKVKYLSQHQPDGKGRSWDWNFFCMNPGRENSRP
jgi:hypothetical protein